MKQLAISTFFFILFTTILKAQISFMPYFRADFSTIELKQADPNFALTYGVSTPKLGYVFGVNIHYQFKEKWSVNSGFLLQNMRDRVNRSLSEFDVPHPVGTPDFDALKLDHRYTFLSIPLQLQYNFRIDKNVTLFTALGGTFDFHIDDTYIFLLYQNGEIIQQTTEPTIDLFIANTEPFNLSAKLDIGITYNLTERIALHTFLAGSMLIVPISGPDVYDTQHFNTGLGLGISYWIKK